MRVILGIINHEMKRKSSISPNDFYGKVLILN